MSPQRSHASRATSVEPSSPARVVMRPTIVLGGTPRSRRRFELQRLLEEPLTVPLGTMHLSPAAQFMRKSTWQRDNTPPLYPAELSHLHAYALQQNLTPSQRQALDREPSPHRPAAHAEPPTAPARPTRHERKPARPMPQPWAARAAAARVLARRAPALQPSAAHRPTEHWLARARVHPPAAPVQRPARPALSPAHFPWHPDARLPSQRSRTVRIHHRGTWTWPVALSLCSMLLAYAITARWLSRAATEHRSPPGISACR